MDGSGTLLAPTTPLRKDKGFSRPFAPLFWHRRKHLVGLSMKFFIGWGGVRYWNSNMYIVSFHFILISFHFNLFKQGKAINYTIALQAALYRKNITP